MTFRDRPKCHKCTGVLRFDSETFLLPRFNGEVRKISMHRFCLTNFNKMATSQYYSRRFEAKRKAHLRTDGIYVA